MKAEVNVLGSPSLIVPTVSVDIKQHLTRGRASELRSCVKEELDVLDSPSLIVSTGSVEVKQHLTRGVGGGGGSLRTQELCETGAGRPGLRSPSPVDCKATVEKELLWRVAFVCKGL